MVSAAIEQRVRLLYLVIFARSRSIMTVNSATAELLVLFLFYQLPVHALVGKLRQLHLVPVQVDMTARAMTLTTVPAHTSVEVM